MQWAPIRQFYYKDHINRLPLASSTTQNDTTESRLNATCIAPVRSEELCSPCFKLYPPFFPKYVEQKIFCLKDTKLSYMHTLCTNKEQVAKVVTGYSGGVQFCSVTSGKEPGASAYKSYRAGL